MHPHHFTLDLDQLDRIFEYRFIQSSSLSFPVNNVELEYMFDTLGFLWLHHDSPPYLLYLLDFFLLMRSMGNRLYCLSRKLMDSAIVLGDVVC